MELKNLPTKVSVNSNWVHSPGKPSGISSKNLPRAREFDKGWDFVENEIETSKKSMDQIFTGENKKKQAEFLSFLEV